MNAMKTLTLVALMGGAVALGGCRTNAGTGTLLGALGGAGLGAALGTHYNHGGQGALIGGAAGAIAGYAIGNEVDRQDRGYRYEGDPRYEPRRERVERVYVDDDPPPERVYVERPRERVIYRERIIYDDTRGTGW